MRSLPVLDPALEDDLRASGTPAPASPRRLPEWLKRQLPRGNGNFFTHDLLRELRLETVCENARCPNRPECYARRTATFMILGNVCTRPCGFCSVPRGVPHEPEADEPERVAEAAHRLGLKHCVITSVTRDDLPAVDCDALTLGQSLTPTLKHIPVARYLPPREFDELAVLARSLGFKKVASGPFVRSSYHADEMVAP